MLRLWIIALTVFVGFFSSAACAAHKAFTDPAKAGLEYELQGEYRGDLKLDDPASPVGAQVIALGGGTFQAVIYRGGLPGEGWKRGDKRERIDGKLDGKQATFKGPNWSATADGRVMQFRSPDGKSLGTLQHVERKSPTLGKKPPKDGIAIFGSGVAEEFPGAKVTEDGLLLAGATSKRTFGDFKLHLEFRTPFMPTARGQGRGNSGAYLQKRYEVQVLDSFGLEGENNECGGIYKMRAPAVNMCYPPLVWQTYDIDFKAAHFDGEQKTRSARATIEHNGVRVYDDVELTDATPGGEKNEYPGKGPLYLQDHGNPVVFRNIWIVPK